MHTPRGQAEQILISSLAKREKNEKQVDYMFSILLKKGMVQAPRLLFCQVMLGTGTLGPPKG